MCFWPMKTFGTERWLVISWRASWIAAPSSERGQQLFHVALVVGRHEPTWSSSMMNGLTPNSLNSDLVDLQYGQYDLENTAE